MYPQINKGRKGYKSPPLTIFLPRDHPEIPSILRVFMQHFNREFVFSDIIPSQLAEVKREKEIGNPAISFNLANDVGEILHITLRQDTLVKE